MLVYLELESKYGDWKGRIFVKAIRETKTQYITNSFPKLGLQSINSKDRDEGIMRWPKNIKELYDKYIIRHIYHKVPNIDFDKIYE